MRNVFFYKTPIGEIGIADDGYAITNVFFSNENASDEYIVNETKLIKGAAEQLLDYFAGKRNAFNLLLDPQGTDFQTRVWKALQEIPYGETRSYKDIAESIGNPKACRAVGMANNKNPIAIFIPCHRVIGANGKLVGYAGGINIKQYLLDLERKNNS